MKNKYKRIALIVIISCLGYPGYSQEVSDSNYTFNSGAELFRQYKFDEAIYWFDSSIKKGHNVAMSYTFKGGAEILLGKLEEGRTDLDMAFSLDSTISQAYFYRARQLMLMNDYNASIIFLKKAIKLAPTDYTFYDNMAKAYLAKHQIDSAKQYANEAIRLTHNGPMLISHLAIIEFEAGEYELALIHQQAALDLSFKVTRKKDPTLLIDIASCEWKLKKYPSALSRCEEVLREYPDYSSAYNLRGLINYDLGKKDKACADFTTASHIKGAEKSGLDNLKTHGCPVEN